MENLQFKEKDGRIYCTDSNGKLIAEITFKDQENGIVNIDHTFVDDSLRGKGIASKLISLAVEKIRSSGKKVSATCPYAKHWLEKNKIL